MDAEVSAAPVRIGIVGLGRLGKRHALNLARLVEDAHLVAAASPVAEERDWARAELGVPTYETLDALLAHDGLDAVWLVTPTALHAEQIEAGLRAGKHVFCEKPVSLSVADCDRVMALAATRPQQQVMIGFMRRFDAGYAAMKSRIDGGALGTVYRVHAESHDPIDPHGFFVKFAPTSGGLFLDCCIHDIDLVRWLVGGTPISVSADGVREQYPGLATCQDVDTATATVRFDLGEGRTVLATFFVSRTSHRGYEATLSVTGTRAAARAGFGLQAVPLIDESAQQQSVTGQADFFQRFGEAFLAEARAFVQAVRSGGPSPLSLADAREATRLAVAMREALEQRRTITL